MNIFDLKNKNIIVTGASGGLGQYIAAFYAQQGANIIICARREPRLKQLKQQLEQYDQIKVYDYALDINDRSAVQNMLSDLEAQQVGVDILVNNAGVGGTKRFLDYNDQDWDTVLGTNLKAPWMCSQEVVHHMMRQNIAGSIINITSILSDMTNLGVAPYCTSKAGLKHLTRVMAAELARFNIRVNAIAPGYMITEINESYLKSEAGQAILKSIPMRRFVEFSDLNGVLLLLASEASRGMTGVEIKVDCGHSCSPI